MKLAVTFTFLLTISLIVGGKYLSQHPGALSGEGSVLAFTSQSKPKKTSTPGKVSKSDKTAPEKIIADDPAKKVSDKTAPEKIVAGDPVKKVSDKTMPGKMVLDDPVKKVSECAGKRGKCDFDHDQHAALDSCVTCHHTNSEKLTKAVEEDVQKCSVCHKCDEEAECTIEGTNEKKKFKGLTAPDSQTAYHGNGKAGSLVGCVDCHKARKDKPKAQAFTKCDECHKKAA